MPSVDVNGCPINYIVEGTGDPILLIHGFASSLQGNWRAPGVIAAIVAAGRKVIAIDCRGHGRSGKPHDPQAYAGAAMADDAIAVLDHLGIEKADLAGYSMGGFLSASLLVNHPQRWRSSTRSRPRWRRRTPRRSKTLARAASASLPKAAATILARSQRCTKRNAAASTRRNSPTSKYR